MGLKLRALRLRFTCSTNWASHTPILFYFFYFIAFHFILFSHVNKYVYLHTHWVCSIREFENSFFKKLLLLKCFFSRLFNGFIATSLLLKQSVSCYKKKGAASPHPKCTAIIIHNCHLFSTENGTLFPGPSLWWFFGTREVVGTRCSVPTWGTVGGSANEAETQDGRNSYCLVGF